MSISQKVINEAEAGDVIAQCLLAAHYYHGEGVPKNIVEAEKWWRKAAEKGNAAAQYYLGFCCYENIGADEAMEWLHKAANNGSHDAQMFLGTLYFWGRVVPRNRVTSLKWLILGSESKRNSKWQPRAFCWIVKALSKHSQVIEARTLAEEWKRSFGASFELASRP